MLSLVSCETGTKPVTVVTFPDVDLQVVKVQNRASATFLAVQDGRVGQMTWAYGKGESGEVCLDLCWANDTLFVDCLPEQIVLPADAGPGAFFIPLTKKKATAEEAARRLVITERARREGHYFRFYSAPLADEWARNLAVAGADSLRCKAAGSDDYGYNYSQLSCRFYPPTGYWKNFWTAELLGKKNYDKAVDRRSDLPRP